MTGDKIIANQLAMLPGFANQHPLINPQQGMGMMSSLYELQQALEKITGYTSISFSSAQIDTGLFSAIAMVKAWHRRQSKTVRSEFILIGDSRQLDFVGGKIDFDLTVQPQVNATVGFERTGLLCASNTAGVLLFAPDDTSISVSDVNWIADEVHRSGGLLVANSGVCRLLNQSGIAPDAIY